MLVAGRAAPGTALRGGRTRLPDGVSRFDAWLRFRGIARRPKAADAASRVAAMAATQDPPQRAAAPLSVRVAFFGERARRELGAWVEPVALAALEAGEPDAAIDALVVDADRAAAQPKRARELAERARAAGGRVIVVERRPAEAAVELADAVIQATGPLAVRPFDWRVINPRGFRHWDVAGFACAAFTSRGVLEAPRPGGAASDEPMAVYADPALGGEPPAGALRVNPPAGGDAALLRALKERLGALDAALLHEGEGHRAAWLARLCAAAVAVVATDVSPTLAQLLGDELVGALTGVAPEDLLDLDHREQVSVAQRRAALRSHSLDARWRQLAEAAGLAVPDRPRVSAILSTRRESWLGFGISQYVRQTYQPRELVVCLHGDEFSSDVEERLREEVDGPLQIVHVAPELTLGDALNQGVEAATGDYVTKMDDDDYYSVDHLWDLVLAAEYSAADLVGKAAEFVYLEDMDLTIRRFMGDTECASDRPLAGGGLMARRPALRSLGGWSSRSRGEDTALIKSFRDARRPLHRTHGYGYILNRHGRDHTWNTYVDYFLVQSQREWRGLRFDEAGIY